MLNTELVVIQLNSDDEGTLTFNSVKEVSNFITKMNIYTPDDEDRDAFPEWKLWETKHSFAEKLFYASQGLANGWNWWKVWINPTNGYIIAYQDFNGKKFSEHFINYMENIGPLDTGDLPCNVGQNVVNNNLSLDGILEKIFTQGLGELTMEEVNYLKEISKDT